MWNAIALLGFIACILFFAFAIIAMIKRNGTTKKKLLYSGISFVLFVVGSVKDTANPKIESIESMEETASDFENTDHLVNGNKSDNVEETEYEITTVPTSIVEEISEKESETTLEQKGKGIETSVFKYAEQVEVTDSRDLTKHLNLEVYMSEDTPSGQASLNVIQQTYHFLQQDDIVGADTVTIGILQSDKRIAQLTIDVKKFVPISTESMSKCVLKAAAIDKMTEEVKQFGQTMELW
jgi:hypothetical protein